MTEAESREIIDSIKETIEKEHTIAATAAPKEKKIMMMIIIKK